MSTESTIFQLVDFVCVFYTIVLSVYKYLNTMYKDWASFEYSCIHACIKTLVSVYFNFTVL